MTAITSATNLVATNNSCTATSHANASALCVASTTVVTPTPTAAGATGSTYTSTWYQPEEESDYTDTMPRFSAEEVLHFYGFNNAAAGGSYAMTDCGSGTLSGASSLLAGAAVAFGVTALAI
jgi:hypothetical protein